MPIPHALLGLLTHGDRYGYELRRELETKLGPEWRLDFGQLYRELRVMHRRRWIACRRRSSEKGPDRKVYAITASGRAELERWLATPVATRRRGRDELPVKLCFGENGLVASGSDDLVVDLLAHSLAASHPQLAVSRRAVGSLEGLLALRSRRAHFAGVHLLDFDSGEYNVPFVKHLVPEEPVLLINLSHREQGLMVARGNPKRIRGVRDLTRRGVRLVNRQSGAGTRLFLFHLLRRAGVDPQAIAGYDREVPTHTAVAAAIGRGEADAGPGIRAAAEASGLDFIALGRERYDLAVPRRIFDSKRFRPVLEALHSDAFRRAASALSGYDLRRMSDVVADVR